MMEHPVFDSVQWVKGRVVYKYRGAETFISRRCTLEEGKETILRDMPHKFVPPHCTHPAGLHSRLWNRRFGR